ncbi:MAG: helix-turn-helix domain-containing protein [Acidobacteriota bacterium]
MSDSDRRGHCSGCPLAYALDILGDRWTLLVLRDLLLMGKRRFSEFAASSEGIATNVLSDRLKRLQERGLIESEPDPEDRRRVVYRPTEAGDDLLPAMVEIIRWGIRHDDDTRAPKVFADRVEEDREALLDDIRSGRWPPG